MKKLPNHLSFLLTKEDFETTEYVNPCGCALATAIKRAGYKLGGHGCPGVGSWSAFFEGVEYGILENDEIHRGYNELPDEGVMVNLLKIDD